MLSWVIFLAKKGYIALDLKTSQIHVSRNIVFYETIYPFHKYIQPNSSMLPNVVFDSTIEISHNLSSQPPISENVLVENNSVLNPNLSQQEHILNLHTYRIMFVIILFQEYMIFLHIQFVLTL